MAEDGDSDLFVNVEKWQHELDDDALIKFRRWVFTGAAIMFVFLIMLLAVT